jgi:hypothetical protein
MSINHPSLLESVAANFVVPAAAATGAFVLTLMLPSEKMNPELNKTRFNRNESKQSHEDLSFEEAQALVEKLSSHVSVPSSLN